MTYTATEVNYTARRVLDALEAIVFRPSSAPSVARARVGRLTSTSRRCDYSRWLLSSQHGCRWWLPLARPSANAETETGAAAYVVVPCYSEVLVIAASGASAVKPGERMQASADAAGCVLLAHREAWRSSLMRIESTLGLDDWAAAGIVDRGYTERPGGLRWVHVACCGRPCGWTSDCCP